MEFGTDGTDGVTGAATLHAEIVRLSEQLARGSFPADMVATELLVMLTKYPAVDDAAHGVHRLVIDDATVERAARVIDPQAWQDSWIEFNPEGCKRAREVARTKARAVLAAAVEAGQ